MKHLRRRTPAEWLNDLIESMKETFMPETPKEWVVFLLIYFLIVVMAMQGDTINELYGYVLLLMESAAQ